MRVCALDQLREQGARPRLAEAMAADHVTWEDWDETKEIIADVRDVDVALRWSLPQALLFPL